MSKYTCFFDGACAPANPYGHMGIGAIIYDEKNNVIFKNSHYVEASDENSNNVAEYLAFLSVIEELEGILKVGDKAYIKGDSKLVCNQMNDKWRIKSGLYLEYALLAKTKLLELRKSNVIGVYWIPREINTIADELSNLCLIEQGVKLFKK
jgi:ribonuclease HI